VKTTFAVEPGEVASNGALADADAVVAAVGRALSNRAGLA